MSPRRARNERLYLKLTPRAHRTLQAAASASNCSVSDFVLESALALAAEALANRRTFVLDAIQWKEFMAALDAHPCSLPRLHRLLKEPGFFETGT